MQSESAPILNEPMRRRRSRHRIFWRIVNPAMRSVAGVGPLWVLLETQGQRTGKPRRTPLARGPADAGGVWLNSVHGRHALWVRNLEVTPEVRIKLASRWHHGHATVHEYDEAVVSRFNLYARSGPKTLGIEPMLVHVALRR